MPTHIVRRLACLACGHNRPLAPLGGICGVDLPGTCLEALPAGKGSIKGRASSRDIICHLLARGRLLGQVCSLTHVSRPQSRTWDHSHMAFCVVSQCLHYWAVETMIFRANCSPSRRCNGSTRILGISQVTTATRYETNLLDMVSDIAIDVQVLLLVLPWPGKTPKAQVRHTSAKTSRLAAKQNLEDYRRSSLLRSGYKQTWLRCKIRIHERNKRHQLHHILPYS